jgi:hypothetical protein
MEKAPGLEIDRVWVDIEPRDRVRVVEQLADITARLSEAHFAHSGSLY